jgi:iron complex outermembrane receptor protein
LVPSLPSAALPALLLSLALVPAHALEPLLAPASGAGDASEAPSVLAPVQVQSAPARNGGATDGLSARPLAQTPLASAAIDQAELARSGAVDLAQALRADPAAGDNYNTFGYVDSAQIRGFGLGELFNGTRDGFITSTHVPVPLENKERIEVVKGLAGMLEANGAPGGLINLVLKQPTDQPLAHAGMFLSEEGSARVTADLGGRLGAGGGFGYRVNAALEERHPQITGAWSHRGLLSGFFEQRLDAAVLQFEFEHQTYAGTSVPGYGLFDSQGTGIASSLPAVINPRINLNKQPWTLPFQSTATTGSVRARFELDPDWSLALRAGGQWSVTNDRIAFPDGCSSGPVPVYNGMCGNGNVDIYQFQSDGERRVVRDSDVRLHGRLRAGGLDQELTLGASVTRYSERYPPDQAYNYSGTVNVFAPQPVPASPAATTPNAPADVHLDALSAADVISLDSHFALWAAGRVTRVSESSALTDGTQGTQLSRTLATPWLALAWSATDGRQAWLSWGQGVEVANAPNHPTVTDRATGAALTLLNPSAVLAPQRSRQMELGLRQAAGKLRLEAALYRIDKPFVDNVPQAGGVVQVSGARAERHQGAELSAQAPLASAWLLHGAFSLIDARTTRAVDPTWVGHRAGNVAPWSAVVDADWASTQWSGLTWTQRVRADGPRPVLPDGSVNLPAHWQWDTVVQLARGGTGSSFVRHWLLTAGVDNVTDRRAWREAPAAPWGSIYLFPAPARTARLGVEVDM